MKRICHYSLFFCVPLMSLCRVKKNNCPLVPQCCYDEVPDPGNSLIFHQMKYQVRDWQIGPCAPIGFDPGYWSVLFCHIRWNPFDWLLLCPIDAIFSSNLVLTDVHTEVKNLRSGLLWSLFQNDMLSCLTKMQRTTCVWCVLATLLFPVVQWLLGLDLRPNSGALPQGFPGGGGGKAAPGLRGLLPENLLLFH